MSMATSQICPLLAAQRDSLIEQVYYLYSSYSNTRIWWPPITSEVRLNCTVLNTMASIKGRFTKASCCNIHLTFPPHQMLVCQVFQGPEPLSRSVGRKKYELQNPFPSICSYPTSSSNGLVPMWHKLAISCPFYLLFLCRNKARCCPMHQWMYYERKSCYAGCHRTTESRVVL